MRLFAAHIDASFTVADATTLPFDGGELSAATPRRSAGDVSQPNTHSGDWLAARVGRCSGLTSIVQGF